VHTTSAPPVSPKNPTWLNITVIRKVSKTQHQNPEFGHTKGEMIKEPEKSTLAFNVSSNPENHQFW
jgi:hypothetical protein